MPRRSTTATKARKKTPPRIENIEVPEQFKASGPGRRMLYILAVLRDQFKGAAPSVNALANAAVVNNTQGEVSNCAHAVRRMIDHGWIELDPDHPDKIVQAKAAAVLTDAGRKILQEASL